MITAPEAMALIDMIRRKLTYLEMEIQNPTMGPLKLSDYDAALLVCEYSGQIITFLEERDADGSPSPAQVERDTRRYAADIHRVAATQLHSL